MSDFRKINQDMNISILINIHHVELALNMQTASSESVPERSSMTDLPRM